MVFETQQVELAEASSKDKRQPSKDEQKEELALKVEAPSALHELKNQQFPELPANGNAGELAVDVGGKSDYMDYMQKLKEVWSDIPQVTIEYKDVNYVASVPEHDLDIPSLPMALLSMFKSTFLPKRNKVKSFRALSSCSGKILPGSMCLILAPPGHGKSVFLKALGLQLLDDPCFSGTVTYNGLTHADALAEGLRLNKMVAYVNQNDIHMPLLTVKETLQFALENSVADPRHLSNAEIEELHQRKVDLTIKMLGLGECQNTIVGSELLRGISGGQKKRLTLGEMIIGNARTLLLDEITTGLDSAASFDILKSLRDWTRVMHGSVVSVLLQPTPEVYALFDNIILMRDGLILYDGPRTGVMSYLEQQFGVVGPADIDEADFLTEFLTDPQKVIKKQHRRELRQRRQSERRLQQQEQQESTGAIDSTVVTTAPLQVQVSSDGVSTNTTTTKLDSPTSDSAMLSLHVEPENKHLHRPDKLSVTPAAAGVGGDMKQQFSNPFSARAMEATWTAQRSSVISEEEVTQSKVMQFTSRAERSAYFNKQFGQEYAHSWLSHFAKNFRRQVLLTGRNIQYIMPRVMQAIFMGLVMGSLFYGIGVDSFSNRIGLILFGIIFAAFMNFNEIEVAGEHRRVVYKQLDAGFYPSSSYILSVVTVNLPVSVAEIAIFGTLLYWLTAFTDEGGRYVFYLLLMFFLNLSMGALYRTVAYSTAAFPIAQQMAGPITAVFLLFGGFLITSEKIPNFLIWLYWLSPFSWAVRSGALNEFNADRFDTLLSNGMRKGDYYLSVWQIKTDSSWKWGGVGYTLGFFIFWVFVSAVILRYKRFSLNQGTKRSNEEEDELTHMADVGSPQAKTTPALAQADPVVVVDVAPKELELSTSATYSGVRAKSASSTLPFEPVVLAWKNIKYTVQIPNPAGKGTVPRVLLQDVNGYSRPGTLTALMGSSGAGKTTLMDVLAGRKTSGLIEGDILVDGHVKNQQVFNRMMGYVEQTDIHVATATVKESLMFAAQLRLPATVTDQQRERFVTEMLALLELQDLADRIIGSVEASIPGLSPGQLKLVTIGVELVANPSVLFLDEPTSGLDSRAALVVMRVIRRIAATGRSVVCTIHQPSAEIFFMFDRLLLLRTGGREVFFGDIGENGVKLVQYFEQATDDETVKMPAHVNPASWMLDVIGAGTGDGKQAVDYAVIYVDSALRTQNQNEVEAASTPLKKSVPKEFNSIYARSRWVQYREVQKRLFRSYWREVDFNLTRTLIIAFLGILFGLVYLQLSLNDLAGINSKLGVMYMTSAFNGVLNCATALPVLNRMRAVYYREHASNTYASVAYSTALGVVEFPYIALNCLLFVIPYYFLVGHVNSGNAFFKYYFAHYLLSMVFNAIGQFLMSALPNITVATQLQGLVFTFLFLFGGVFIQAGSIPAGWKWFYFLEPVPKAHIAFAHTQFDCDVLPGNPNRCPQIQIFSADGQSQLVYVYDYVVNYLDTGISADVYWRMIGWLVLSWLVVRIFVALAIKFISHLKR